MAQLKVTVTKTGIFKRKAGIRRLFTRALINSAQKVAEVDLKAARDDFIKKKKAEPKHPSFIFNSFTYETKASSGTHIRSVIYAGGPSAPYAIFVDQPRKGFAGYFFMDAGLKAAKAQVKQIANNEFKKIPGVKVGGISVV